MTKVHIIYLASILTCLLSVCNFALTSCKDDNEEGYEIVYPNEESTPFTVTDLKGRLYYDEVLKNWVISPEMESPYFHNGVEEVTTLIISDMKEEYKKYEGEIICCGTSIYLYTIIYQANVGHFERIYSIDLSDISSNTSHRSAVGLINDMCGTISSTPPNWFFTRSSSELSYSKHYNFRLFVHVIRNSAGEGHNKDNVSSTIIENLNYYYEETNISFSLSGSEYIDSDYYIQLSRTNCTQIFDQNPHSNAIDIYVFSTATNFGTLAGKADGITSTACLVKNNYYTDAVLAHEISHCLGLYHTHHGTVYEGGDDQNQIPELVNGSNSAIAGDYITDTPADPNKWNYCNYIGTSTDANGDYYRPDPYNIMSYSSCIENFTQKQIERIHQTIENTPILKATCTTTTKQITGPTYINDEANYSIDVPEGSIVLWNITCKTYTDKTNAPSITTETLTGSSITLVNKNPQSTSQRYEMDVTITTPKGYVMHAPKTVYHVLFSGKTGTLRWGYTGTTNYSDTISILYPSQNKTIEVTQGGHLAFYYADESGASSQSEPSSYIFEMSNTSSFNKVPGTTHAFYCKTDALPITIPNVLLMTKINGISNIIQIPIKILAKNTYSIKEDTIEIDTLTNLNFKQLNKY